MILYDVSQRDSFNNIRTWIEEVDTDCANAAKILLAGKSDIENPQVSSREGEALAKTFGIPFFEVSSKSDHNVTEAFGTLANAILAQAPEAIEERSKLAKSLPKPKKSCC